MSSSSRAQPLGPIPRPPVPPAMPQPPAGYPGFPAGGPPHAPNLMPTGVAPPFEYDPHQQEDTPVFEGPHPQPLPQQGPPQHGPPQEDPVYEGPSLAPTGPEPQLFQPHPQFTTPPPDEAPVIDKMASYVAKNGPDFEYVVKNKADTRFDFVHEWHQYNAYYEYKKKVAREVGPFVMLLYVTKHS